MKTKRCKACGKEFTPDRAFQKACGYRCAIELAQEAREKAVERRKRRESRAARVKLKTRSDWLREAQSECNKYVRERDRDLPCISCGRHHRGQYHAGHYRSIGAAPELRFHPGNIHKQCSACNNHKSGNAIEYRIGLVRKLGAAYVEWIERQNSAQNLTIDDIKEIKAYYKEQLKWLKNNGIS